MKKLDFLDFPGTRATKGIAGGIDENLINDEIENSKSTHIANAYKRGRLLYLFDIYNQNYEITMLLLCTPPGNIEAAITKLWLRIGYKIVS